MAPPRLATRTPGALLGVAAGALCAALLTHGAVPTPAEASPPVNAAKPSVVGVPRVGSTIRVDPGEWSGDAPVTFSYRYQICSASGTNCSIAPGLFANNGPRPTLLLLAGTAGRHVKVTVTATNPDGKRTATAPLTPAVAAYPATAAPVVEFVNGLPEKTSQSTRSTFQFQATGSGVQLTCQLNARPAKTCPTNNKVTYGALARGEHTMTVIARNAYGQTQARHQWLVEPLPSPRPCPDCYHPPVGTTWQWQLNPDAGATGIDMTVPADMYDIDAFTTSADTVAALEALPGTTQPRRATTCYFPAGTRENWRPDATSLDPQVLGNPYAGFTDERWIDVRQLTQIGPWLEARMDMCRAKGFDAIEYDNVDGWAPANKTGLNITAEDEIAFIVYLANEAHERGLSMALKSNVEQVPDVMHYVDFAVVEECFEYQECTTQDPNTDGRYGYDMLISLGKPVFEVEYDAFSLTSNVCARANALGFSAMYKRVELDSYRVPCWSTAASGGTTSQG